MTISIICRKTIKVIAVVGFWLCVWQIAATMLGIELLLPTPIAVVKTLYFKFFEKSFLIAVAASITRVLLGFLLAASVGALVGLLTAKSQFINALISPLLLIIRAAPVASFVILALVWIKSDTLPIAISFLTGLPIVWKAVHDSTLMQDKKLLEAANVFRFSAFKTFLYVTVPSVLPSFVSAAVTTLGFCWKSAVAAEIICLPRESIGKGLYSAKQHLETAEVFAYTLITVLLSILFELLLGFIVKKLLGERQVLQNGDKAE